MSDRTPAAVARPRLAARLRAGEGVEVAGVLFDMDGTLIDSIAAVEEAWMLWAGELGIEAPTAAAHGRTATALIEALGVPEAERAAAERRLSEIEARPGQRIAPLPGALPLLRSIPAGRWGIVTSAAPSVAAARLAAGGIPTPGVLVTAGDVAAGKPAPDPYLRGAESLRGAAGDGAGGDGVVLAVEDTVAGLRSARDAGCLTVAVAGTADARELAEVADVVVSTLASLAITADEDALRVRIAS
jgi:sugar-phosphatase